MAIIASKGKTTFEPISEGVHIAICIAVVDLGTQTSSWNGEEKSQHKVAITWEVPEETVMGEEGPVPKVITRMYTLSLNEKSALRPHLESWRGRSFTDKELEAFDLRAILGKGCQIGVLHEYKNDRTYAGVGNVMSLPRGMEPPAPCHPLVYFDLSDPKSLEQFESLPEFLKLRIEASPEYAALINRVEQDVSGESDLPF